MITEGRLPNQAKIGAALFRFASTPMVILDRNFNILRINEAYARACRRDVAEFTGKTHFDLYPPDARGVFEEVVRSKKAFQANARPFTSSDHPEWGTTFWDWNLVPILDEAGEVESLVFSLTDVTERKRNEDTYHELNNRLRHRTVQLRKLAQELSQTEERERRRIALSLHDNLQQLLVGAKFNLDVLGTRAETPGMQKSLESVAHLIDQALVSCTSLVGELSPTILYEVGLGAALEWLARQMLNRYGLTVETAIEPNLEPGTKNVSVLLFQSVRELLINVMKHARSRTAYVSMSRANGTLIRIEVRDEGVGFDPSRLHDAAELAGGLGLFSIRERLDMLGGTLEIDSAPGMGARMTMTAPMQFADSAIPASYESVPHAASAAFRGEAHGGGKTAIRVLLVDDHEIVRAGLVELLLQFAPEIEVVGEAGNGMMALDLARSLHPDVILMDVSMPKLNGVEATRRILAEHPDIKIIGLSMFEEDERAAAMRQAGAVAYVHKAGATDKLIATIFECFRLR